jgi:hypothetical protein
MYNVTLYAMERTCVHKIVDGIIFLGEGRGGGEGGRRGEGRGEGRKT